MSPINTIVLVIMNCFKIFRPVITKFWMLILEIFLYLFSLPMVYIFYNLIPDNIFKGYDLVALIFPWLLPFIIIIPLLIKPSIYRRLFSKKSIDKSDT